MGRNQLVTEVSMGTWNSTSIQYKRDAVVHRIENIRLSESRYHYIAHIRQRKSSTVPLAGCGLVGHKLI